jgi:hypothetical protein
MFCSLHFPAADGHSCDFSGSSTSSLHPIVSSLQQHENFPVPVRREFAAKSLFLREHFRQNY